MKIHEYQGKEILREYGVAVPTGKACFSVDEAVSSSPTASTRCAAWPARYSA
jgi:succinyl-CoA synthetase beta subunit